MFKALRHHKSEHMDVDLEGVEVHILYAYYFSATKGAHAAIDTSFFMVRQWIPNEIPNQNCRVLYEIE